MKKVFFIMVLISLYFLFFGQKYTTQKCVLLQEKKYKQRCSCVTLSGDIVKLGRTSHQSGSKGDTIIVSIPIK